MQKYSFRPFIMENNERNNETEALFATKRSQQQAEEAERKRLEELEQQKRQMAEELKRLEALYSKKSQAEEFFRSIIDDLQKSKIKAVFSLSPITWNYYRGHRTYMTDTEVYILFENGYCLILDYRFVDFLEIEYRKMTVEEQSAHSDILVKDFFNTSNDICDFRDNRVYRTETCSLEYGIVPLLLLSVRQIRRADLTKAG